MSAEHNRWIVSSKQYFEHRDPKAAEAERVRLQKLHPEKTYRVYRIKRTVDYRDEREAAETMAVPS